MCTETHGEGSAVEGGGGDEAGVGGVDGSGLGVEVVELCVVEEGEGVQGWDEEEEEGHWDGLRHMKNREINS